MKKSGYQKFVDTGGQFKVYPNAIDIARDVYNNMIFEEIMRKHHIRREVIFVVNYALMRKSSVQALQLAVLKIHNRMMTCTKIKAKNIIKILMAAEIACK